jgi:hypothetical protein
MAMIAPIFPVNFPENGNFPIGEQFAGCEYLFENQMKDG